MVALSRIEAVQSRQMPSGAVNSPLAVSVKRALAAVCAMQRITVYDLNDDEEDDEDEDEESEEGDEEDAGGAAAAEVGGENARPAGSEHGMQE